MERVALFIDGANTSWAGNTIKLSIDWERLGKFFRSEFQWDIINAFYYTALIEEPNGNIIRQDQMDWLRFHGYTIKTKRAKQYKRPDGSMRVKGNMDIEMVVGMVRAADTRNISRIVLMSGDGDFCSAVEYLQETKGVPVTVVSTIPMISNDLRAMCNQYIDIRLIRENIEVRPEVEVRKRSIVGLLTK